MGFNEAGVGDMVQLPTLDEASMVQNLRERFDTGVPYTLCGQICISVNPFKWLPLYTEANIMRFNASANPFSGEAPHIYAVVHETLRRLLQGADTGTPLPSQSILVSGESGAGKTEATKICMQYLAKVDALRSAGSTGGAAAALTDRVLQCNPVLEAFGNAQTSRNGNSSRFGKFLQLHYSRDGRQLGASISTYLLERSRVVRPPHGEANYHVFYALAGGAGDAMRKELCLGGEEEYDEGVLPTPGGPRGKRPPRDRRTAEWEAITEALRGVGFSEAEVSNFARLLTGVLTLASLRFVGDEGEDGQRSSSPDSPEAIERAAGCLEVCADDLSSALCSRHTYMSTGEQYEKSLDEVQATDAAHALAKAIYGRMFDAIVGTMNALTACEGDESQSGFVGILDIFGFEHFEYNSFEQLCINFANEMLQQQFNADTFKQQQLEYEAEGVPWEKIEYEDNSERIELLALRRTGAFALLDEECRLQTGSAGSFVDKLQRAHPTHKFLSFPKLQRKGEGPQFTIAHYAGEVRYSTQLFLQKNTDPLHPDLEVLVQRSRNKYLRALFVPKTQVDESPLSSRRGSGGGGGGGGRELVRRESSRMFSTTVGTRFKEGVSSLMETISATSVHYVRCIKPNSSALSAGHAGAFNTAMVAEQLRCAGMYEAVRISRAAYPHRLQIESFMQLFALLVARPAPADAAALAKAVLPKGGFCVGKTKVFLAPGVLARLEERRDAMRFGAAVVMQTMGRGRAARLLLREALRAACRLESHHRARAARRALTARRRAVLRIQRTVRGALAVQLCDRMRLVGSVVVIQAAVRRRRVILHFVSERRAAIAIQSRARVSRARRRFEEELAADRLRKSYLGQLQEARARLESEANVKEQLQSDKAKLEQQLANSYTVEAYEARLTKPTPRLRQ